MNFKHNRRLNGRGAPNGRPCFTCGVPWPQPLLPGSFKERKNRFAATVQTEAGQTLLLHVANSGRMSELLVAGAPVLYRLRPAAHRRTAGDLLLVRHGGRWVSIDARMPNRLFTACFEAGQMAPFVHYTQLQGEVVLGQGRIDFKLTGPKTGGQPKEFWVETKSCNLVSGGIALFPDAPTTRGARHLRDLQQLAAQGIGAAVIFFIQRDDVEKFQPHRQADPAFADALQGAAAAGVKIFAYKCSVTPAKIEVVGAVPVELV